MEVEPRKLCLKSAWIGVVKQKDKSVSGTNVWNLLESIVLQVMFEKAAASRSTLLFPILKWSWQISLCTSTSSFASWNPQVNRMSLLWKDAFRQRRGPSILANIFSNSTAWQVHIFIFVVQRTFSIAWISLHKGSSPSGFPLWKCQKLVKYT